MRNCLAYLTLIIGIFSVVHSATAEDMVISEEEKAVFAYLKLTEQEPDFENWIKNTQRYQEARKAEKDKLFESEKKRLDWGFATHDPKKDLVTFRSPIRLTTYTDENGKRVVNTRFVNNTQNEESYFPIQYGPEPIAFIIQDLEKYRNITLQPEEIKKIKEYFYDSAPYEAIMEIRVRPLSADNKDKLFVDYKEQWLMLGDIAYIKIDYYDEFKLQHINVWDSNAPWYLDESQRALLEMFQEQN